MTDVVVVDGLEFRETATYQLANKMIESAAVQEALDFSGSHYHMEISDAAVASESVTGIRVNLLSIADSAAAAESNDENRLLGIADVANAADAVTASNQSVLALSDAAVAHDAVTGLMIANITQTANATETLSVYTTAVIVEAADATSTISTLRTSTAVISDSAVVVDSVVPFAVAIIVSSAVTADAATGIRTAIETITQSAAAAETVLHSGHTIAAIADAAVASSSATVNVVATQTITDEAEASERVRSNVDTIGNFWNNTHNAAASLWSGLAINSMVEADGAIYGAGPDGIYLLDPSTDDEGAPIASEVLWDLMDMGSPQKKRIPAIYVAASVASPFTVRLVNEQGSFTYKTRKGTSPKAIQHRALPGRGLESVFFRIGVTHNKDFAVEQVLAETEQVARRI